MHFTPDPNIQTVAEAYALDARDFFQQQFRVTLDWSDASILSVETVMESMHRGLASARPTEEHVMNFAKLFGSYVGEVYRRRHGATWGIIEHDGQQFPGLQATGSGNLFWPWGRARNRLVEGADHNLWHYYSALIKPA